MRIAKTYLTSAVSAAAFALALGFAPASTVHAQAFPSFNCDAPGANLQTKIDGAPYGATIFFGGNCDDGPYFINAGQNLHLRGFSSGGTLSAPGGGNCVVCVRFAHVKFTRLDIDATGANAGISVKGGTAEIFDVNIDATGTFAGIRVFGGTVDIAGDTNIDAANAFAGIHIEGGEVRIGPDTNIDATGATGAENGISVNGGTVSIFKAVIRNAAGVGIHVRNSSSANISESRIEDGDGDGIVIISSSSADISANMITGNGGDGVSITFHSSVSLGDANTIEGNTAFGVRCGVSGALVVFAVQDFTGGNTGGNAFVDPACELLDFAGDPEIP